MLQELSEKGIHFTEAQRSSIYGPTGLDLGAETAAEIALSVCSEIMAVLQQRHPMHLKQKSEPIHSQA
jgi:xanthine/CO dehydrogenase XdhC/CoxF family maturation factor